MRWPIRFSGESWKKGWMARNSLDRPFTLRIYDAWDWLNEVAFSGEMLRPKIVVWERLYSKHNGKKIMLEGAYTHEDKTLFLWWKGRYPFETLYHEMAHQYINEVLDSLITGHGELYWNIYNDGLEKINRELVQKQRL